MLGLGVVGGAVAGAGMAMGSAATKDVEGTATGAARQDTINKGTTGNVLAYIGAGVGGVGLVVGPLMGVAAKRKRRRRLRRVDHGGRAVLHAAGRGVSASFRSSQPLRLFSALPHLRPRAHHVSISTP